MRKHGLNRGIKSLSLLKHLQFSLLCPADSVCVHWLVSILNCTKGFVSTETEMLIAFSSPFRVATFFMAPPICFVLGVFFVAGFFTTLKQEQKNNQELCAVMSFVTMQINSLIHTPSAVAGNNQGITTESAKLQLHLNFVT